MNLLAVDPAFGGKDRTGVVLIERDVVTRAFELGGLFADQIDAVKYLAMNSGAAVVIDATGGGRAWLDTLAQTPGIGVTGIILTRAGVDIAREGRAWRVPTRAIWSAARLALQEKLFEFELPEADRRLLVEQLGRIKEHNGKITGKFGKRGRDDVATAFALAAWTRRQFIETTKKEAA